MKITTHHFFKLLVLSVCIQGCSAVSAPQAGEEKPKTSWLSAQNRFKATSGAVIATPIVFALREALMKAHAQTQKNKKKTEYYKQLAKNFGSHVAKLELWKRHFLRLYAIVECFSKQKAKETRKAWAIRTKNLLVLYAKQNPVHAAVLALWTANAVGTTLHAGYKTACAARQGIQQWINAFNPDNAKQKQGEPVPTAVTLNFTAAAEENPDAAPETPATATGTPRPHAAPVATPPLGGGAKPKRDGATQAQTPEEAAVQAQTDKDFRAILPYMAASSEYFAEKNRAQQRAELRAWIEAFQKHPAGTHVAMHVVPGLAAAAGNAVASALPLPNLVPPQWFVHVAALPIDILTHVDPQNDKHLDLFIDIASVATQAGALPVDLSILGIKGTWHAGKWIFGTALPWTLTTGIPAVAGGVRDVAVAGANGTIRAVIAGKDITVACGGRSKRGAGRAWNALVRHVREKKDKAKEAVVAAASVPASFATSFLVGDQVTLPDGTKMHTGAIPALLELKRLSHVAENKAADAIVSFVTHPRETLTQAALTTQMATVATAKASWWGFGKFAEFMLSGKNRRPKLKTS